MMTSAGSDSGSTAKVAGILRPSACKSQVLFELRQQSQVLLGFVVGHQLSAAFTDSHERSSGLAHCANLSLGTSAFTRRWPNATQSTACPESRDGLERSR